MTISPATYAMYSQGGPVGILPNQSMFVTDPTRKGMFDARKSFIGVLNYIFFQNPIATDRPLAINALNETTPVSQYLIWRRPAGSSHIEVVPPSYEWDFQVYTTQERDELMLDPIILSHIINGNTFRVLVNGLGNQDQPQWCVYEASLSNNPGATESDILVAPSSVYTLATSYDFSVNSFADRDLLLSSGNPPSIGQRVYVTGNPQSNGFWSIWKYVGLNSGFAAATANGFLLTRYQTYDTSDFWNYIDWYASGYSASAPPIVTYATVSARDAAENPPKSSLVKIENNGSGSWIWTAYENGNWTVVAQQNGTIEFSAKFYNNPSAPTIGIEPFANNDLSNITNRDGSWELRIMFDILRDYGLLLPLEVNQTFFSMLHFIHAQQNQVAWAFKTSFMNIGGYNQQLAQSPVTPIDNITNITDYITEISPYRVKIREFTQVVSPLVDNTTVNASDFDFPPYYDSSLQSYRNLDPSNANDLLIIQNTAPWNSWYANYQGNNSPVRQFRITVNFDRVDTMPILSTQWFTYNSGISNPNHFSVDVSTNAVTNLNNYIVEVYVNGTELTSDEFHVSSDDLYLTANSLVTGDTIKVLVRQSLTSGLEAARIQQFYNPTGDDAEDNLQTLMGLETKTTIADGGSFTGAVSDYETQGNYTGISSDETINPDSQHFGLADPIYDKNRPEELIAVGSGESLVFTTYDANTPTNISVYSTARPGTDLLAPEYSGDFDEGSLDSIPYDQGYGQEILIDNSGVQHGAFVVRHDAWQINNWTANTATGTLVNNLYANATSIQVAVGSNAMVFNTPTVELITDANGVTQQVTTAPGVVWIGLERVEFFSYSVSNSIVTLSQIRRGTHGTAIGSEQLNAAHYIANGTAKDFYLNNDVLSSNIIVSINAPIANGNVVITGDTYTGFPVNFVQQLNTNYTLTQVSNNVKVSFVNAPTANTSVYIRKSSSVIYPAGTLVTDGAWQLYTLITN